MTKYRAVGKELTRGEAYEAIFDGKVVLSMDETEYIKIYGRTLVCASNFKNSMLTNISKLHRATYYLAEEIPEEPEPELEIPEILSVWRNRSCGFVVPVLGIEDGGGRPVYINTNWVSLEDFHDDWEPVK